MSIWTHVAATIRFDDIRAFGGGMAPDLGNTVVYDSQKEDWDKCNVPCGSEGSLQYHLWINPDASNLAAYTATIFGDLRDYQNVGEILDYLDRITQGKMVRNGVATIEVEGREPVVMHYHEDKWRTISSREPALIPSRESDNHTN